MFAYGGEKRVAATRWLGGHWQARGPEREHRLRENFGLAPKPPEPPAAAELNLVKPNPAPSNQ